MDSISSCYGCIPIRNGVIALGVLTLLEAIGEILVFVTFLGEGNCAFYDDVLYYHGNHNESDGYHNDNDGYHNNNDGHHYDNDGYHFHYDYDQYSSAEFCWSWYASSVCIWSIAVGSVSFFSALCLLIGVNKMKPNLLKLFVILMGLNGAAYLALGIFVVVVSFALFLFVIGIWFICWSVLVLYFVFVVHFYRKKMIQQLMNRGLVITTYPPAVVMPGIPVFHAVIPGGTYPHVMTVHPGQPGRGITTQKQPGIYAQPGTYAQPGAFLSPPFYTYEGTYVHPLPGSCTQPGIHTENGTSPNNDQPPLFTQKPKSTVQSNR